MKSTFLTLNWKDAVKGLVVAVLTATFTAVINILQTGVLPTHEEMGKIGIIALTAGLSYILKNWLTNSNDELLTKEKP